MSEKSAKTSKPKSDKPVARQQQSNHTSSTSVEDIIASPQTLDHLSHSELFQLQRTFGNSAIHRMTLPPEVHQDGNDHLSQTPSDSAPNATEGQSIQRVSLWTKDVFKKQTHEGFFAGRGKTLKNIESLLEEYYGDFQPIEDQMKIVREILQHTGNYLENHANDKSRRKRRSAMINFKRSAELELESLDKLNKKLADQGYSGDGVTTGNRTDNVQSIKDKHEGSAKSLFEKLGGLVDRAVPMEGDKAKIEIEFKFPVDPSGVGFLGGRMTLETERGDQNMVKIRNEVTIKGGGTIAEVVEISAELGGYFESQAKGAEKTLRLVSYAFYRRFEESKVLPRKMSNFMWGGSTGIIGFVKAERWASNVEKDTFGGLGDDEANNTYVETGGLVGAAAKANVGIGEAAAQIKHTRGTRYTKKSIEQQKSGGLGSARKNYWFGQAQERIGEDSIATEIGAKLDAGPFGGELKAKWTRVGTQKDWAIEASFAGSVPANELLGNGIAPAMITLVSVAKRQIQSKAFQEDEKARKQGANADSIAEGVYGLSQLMQLPSDAFKPSYTVEPPKDGVSGKIGLKGTLKIAKGSKGEFTVEIVKSSEVNLGVFKGKAEKSSRIIRIKYEAGEWDVTG